MKENEAIKAIITRESCRKYKPEKLTREEIDTIVTAGAYAPNAGGRQPWNISVVTNQEIIDFIGVEGGPPPGVTGPPQGKLPDGFTHAEPKGGFISKPMLSGKAFAPLVIVISEVKEMSQNIASILAAENMMIAAQSLGISSMWMGAMGANLFQQNLDDPNGSPLIKQLVPEGNFFVCALAFGYPDPEGFRHPRVERRTDNITYFE